MRGTGTINLPRWTPAALDSDEWDLTFSKRIVIYRCKAPGCVVTCGTLADTKGHERETGHAQFFLRVLQTPHQSAQVSAQAGGL